MDVSMNSHGVSVEKALGRPIMSSLHAGWAFGGMAGAGFVALVPRARRRRAPAHRDRLRAAAGRAAVRRARRIGHGSAAEGDDTPGFTLPSRGVVLLAVLCFLVMITEGAMADWSGLYLRQDLGASAARGRARLLVLHRRHDRRPARRRLRSTPASAPVALLRGGALLTGIPLGAMLLIGAAGAPR